MKFLREKNTEDCQLLENKFLITAKNFNDVSSSKNIKGW